MLYICTNLTQYQEFADFFRQTFGDSCFDLSKAPVSKLTDESNSILQHHSSGSVFLGYLEPGWMLDSNHQVQLRKLIRKFPVAMVTNYVDSIPFSWKNETHSIYTHVPLNHNGDSKVVNDGGAL
jgi:hypothetical protein